jgi:hypothetical protein
MEVPKTYLDLTSTLFNMVPAQTVLTDQLLTDQYMERFLRELLTRQAPNAR